MSSNAGFIGLHNPLGLFFIVFSAFIVVMVIVVGARLVRAKEASDRAYRAELRRQVEARKLGEPRV